MKTDASQLRGRLEQIASLASPYGVIGSVQRNSLAHGLPDLTTVSAYIGSGRADSWSSPHLDHVQSIVAGSSRLRAGGQVAVAAIAEAAERYSAGASVPQDMVTAAWAALDGPAIDPANVPRCSVAELRRPGSRTSVLEAGRPIRWTRAVELSTGVKTWVPAVMASYKLPKQTPAEDFWYQISTGYAVHDTIAEALVRAILEVIERDALAISWLQRLPLPLVPEDRIPRSAREALEWTRKSALETYLFDATLDLGVPTCLVLQVAPHSRRVRHVVGCATARTMPDAAERALAECIACRIRRERAPEDVEIETDFTRFRHLEDSAKYMTRPEMSHAFEFLLEGAQARPTRPARSLPADSGAALAGLLQVLDDAGLHAYALDRTCDELRAVGLVSVCVLIPGLQPMSLEPLLQYRAHPRLYTAPPRAGYPAVGEEGLNPWPLPFD